MPIEPTEMEVHYITFTRNMAVFSSRVPPAMMTQVDRSIEEDVADPPPRQRELAEFLRQPVHASEKLAALYAFIDEVVELHRNLTHELH